MKKRGKGRIIACVAALLATVLLALAYPALREHMLADRPQTPPGVRALAGHALIAALPGLRLYGADRPLLQALELALADGWLAPAFTWPRDRREMILTAQALYAAGVGAPQQSY